MSCCGSAVLFIINIVFITMGLFLFTGGITVVHFQGENIEKIIDLIYTLLQKIDAGSQKDDINKIIRNIFTFVSPFGIAIAIIGIGCVIISLFGICGVCMNNKKLFGIYAVFVGILALAVLITPVVLYYKRNDFIAETIKFYNESVKGYRSLKLPDVRSVFVAVTSITLKCCGLKSGEDFTKSTNFQGTDTFNGVQYSGIRYPPICCKFNFSIVIASDTCPDDFNEQNSNMQYGCEEKLKDVISEYSYTAFIVLYGGSTVLMAILTFTVAKIRSIGDKPTSVED
ncbi:Tetraspanin-CD63 receptor [Schistosoma japonicum]|nr:Tetraspanin-CD63 receptor [Schistosoma japonicum]